MKASSVWKSSAFVCIRPWLPQPPGKRRRGESEKKKRKGSEGDMQRRAWPKCTQRKKNQKTQLPAEAGSQTSSDFQPPSTDTILSGGFGEKRCRGLCLNMGSSGTVISKTQSNY